VRLRVHKNYSISGKKIEKIVSDNFCHDDGVCINFCSCAAKLAGYTTRNQTQRINAEFYQAEMAKKARVEAEALRHEIELARGEVEQAVVRTRNNFHLGVLLLFIAVLATYIIKKSNKEKIMQENQKFGIVTIICSALASVLAVMVSDGWHYQFDFLQNIMSKLQIQIFVDEASPSYNPTYFIDVPTKYVVLSCIFAAAYGFTTYLGISRVPKIK